MKTTSVSTSIGFAVFLAALFLFPCAAGADDAVTVAQSTPAAAFGSPPSGEYPILYNDHTVYATPDILKEDRVLAALVKDGQIYVPLRSMFEQMGATVSESSDGQTTTAVKTGTTVSVTIGKNEVVINGVSRPLDVPPMIYKGIVLVPVRVLSEALGAYVQWVPDRQIVVVRYIAPTPPPTPEPTAAPTIAPAPSPTPSPVPTERPYTVALQGAWTFAGSNYNEFTNGRFCPESFLLSGAYLFRGSPFAVKVDFRQDSYLTSDNINAPNGNQSTRFSTIDGGTAVVPVFLGRQTTLDARVEYQVLAPRFNVGVGYLWATNNYGYPQLSGFGFGVEKLPDLRSGVSFFGSAFYYPAASGNYTIENPASSNAGTTYRQQYDITKYDIGLALSMKRAPVYLYAGFSGDQYAAKQYAPIGQTHTGPYVGLGVRF